MNQEIKYLVSSIMPVNIIAKSGNVRASLSFFVHHEGVKVQRIYLKNPKDETQREIEQLKMSIRNKRMQLREIKYNVDEQPMKFTISVCESTLKNKRRKQKQFE